MPVLVLSLAELRWRPGIGDPTLGGWLTVLCYAFAALLCWRRARVDAYRRAWLALAAILTALAANKQLNIQSLFTELGREQARAQGWYQERRFVQEMFVMGVATLTVVGMLLAAYHLLRRPVGSLRWATLGLSFLLSFVVIRAASLHYFDRFIGMTVAGLRVNWLLEIGGIAAIAIATLTKPVSTRGKSRRSTSRTSAL